jgi:ribose 5-phosphate isomerase B
LLYATKIRIFYILYLTFWIMKKIDSDISKPSQNNAELGEEFSEARVGIAADHGGFDLKEQLINVLRDLGYRMFDFGANSFNPDDDYPDFVLPLARAVASGKVERGIAICGSGVGACIAANKVPGVRASLIHETYSARQGVEDDDMNLICLGGRVISYTLAMELTQIFLTARFNDIERHRRRLDKIANEEKKVINAKKSQ